MADPRMFSEDELTLLLADRVASETATLTAKVTELEAENADLKSQNDTLEAAKLAAEQAKASVEQEFADFKAETEKAAETAKVKDERSKAVAAVMSDEFVTEERAERYAGMEQAAFDSLLADLTTAKEAAGKPGAPKPEHAAFSGGAPAAPSASADGQPSTASRLFGALAAI